MEAHMLVQIFSHPIQSFLSVLLAGVGVLLASMIVPGFKVRGGFVSAVLIGFVYGFLKLFLTIPLLFLAWPVVILGGLLAFFAANAFLLWLTDQLLDNFELESFSSLILGTLTLSIFDLFLFGGAFY
jgi:putative membrane protein